MSVNAKVHHYFSSTPPARWDIQHFLAQELSSRGKHYDHNRALSNWISSLSHLSKDDNPSNAVPAKAKIESYYLNGSRGHPSDKTTAYNWHNRITRRSKKRKRDGTSDPPEPRTQRIRNIFHVHGEVNLNSVTGGAGAVLDDSLNPSAAAAAAPATPSGSDHEESSEASHLEETLRSLGHWYVKMTTKLALSDGRFLEDLLHDHVLSLDHLSPAHFFIVDQALLEKILKDSPDEVITVMDTILKFPPFPENMRISLLRYQAAKTTDQCRDIARGTSDDDEDVYWIDDVFRHVIKLITKSGDILSYDDLKEGVWDSLVYPRLWDEYLVTIPTIVLQRKEIPLVARVPYPYRPGRPLHYDGVVQSRKPRSSRTEFAIFEVSRRSTDVRKIASDRDKLIGGCRAMLCSLMELVEYDAEALPRLVVVGVLHAGRNTQVLAMSCLSRNVLAMSEGESRALPVNVKKLTALYDIMHDVWKVKWAIETTEAAVNDFFDRKESRELEERGKKWREEHVC